MNLRARRSTSGRERPPGDVLVRPIALAALALLILNDHVLKSAFPGPLTGKLSDVAGLMLFPIVLVAGWELGARLIPNPLCTDDSGVHNCFSQFAQGDIQNGYRYLRDVVLRTVERPALVRVRHRTEGRKRTWGVAVRSL